MGTDKERRDVVARMRSVTDEEYQMCFLIEILAGCIGATYVYDSEGQIDEQLIVHRLADLIEPHTCYPTEQQWGTSLDRVYIAFKSSECGGVIDRVDKFVKFTPPNYCMYCGSKIVKDNE